MDGIATSIFLSQNTPFDPDHPFLFAFSILFPIMYCATDIVFPFRWKESRRRWRRRAAYIVRLSGIYAIGTVSSALAINTWAMHLYATTTTTTTLAGERERETMAGRGRLRVVCALV